MLYYSYDNYQARRLEMVRHAQLPTVTVSDNKTSQHERDIPLHFSI